jgi:hypothetical protein
MPCLNSYDPHQEHIFLYALPVDSATIPRQYSRVPWVVNRVTLIEDIMNGPINEVRVATI